MNPCCPNCGQAAPACGCCTGAQVLTPAAIHNRPGLSRLAYRVGTHARFLASMKARLASAEVEVAAPGQPPHVVRPLAALTTRAHSDFSIALLDGWATVADLLSFYQERIANEGYLGTATERRSVLELARLAGYALRPGVAASVHLAFTIDAQHAEPTTIAAGTRAQSLPGPGEDPQSFETSEDLEARREWNDLQVRRTRPQNITLRTALLIERLVVMDSVNGLRAGEPLLLLFAEDGSVAARRTIRSTEGPAPDGKSTIHLDPVPGDVALTIGVLITQVAALQSLLPGATGAMAGVIDSAERVLRDTLLDPANAQPHDWAKDILRVGDGGDPNDAAQRLVEELQAKVEELLEQAQPAPPPPSTGPDRFVGALLKPRVLQARNSLRLPRNLRQAFATGADSAPQMLLNFAPALQGTYYRAWAGANEETATPELVGAFVLRTNASLFGANVPKLFAISDGTVPPQDTWGEWKLDQERPDGLFLEQVHSEITAGSYALVQRMDTPTPQSRVYRIKQATTAPRTAYGISGKSTHLQLEADWWQALDGDMPVLRAAQVWAQSSALTLAEEPITGDIGSQPDDADNLSIELAGLHRELKSGRWVIVRGERSDIEGVRGVHAAELMMVASLTHGRDPAWPDDQVHTTLHLATRSAFRYRRDSVVVCGNVVRATHGETRNELLGSGDGAQALQHFTLKQPPLTFVSAPTPAGAASTLAVYVDDVRWHESTSLAWLDPKARGFITRTDDEGTTHILFGDGEHGARLPTGVQNVRASYRSGIGAAGNVRAEQISLLVTRPLGVKEVINPLRATGGADREGRDLARANAPLALQALDRLVSLADYAHFARTFAGVAKAATVRASDGRRQSVLLTIAGVDDAAIDTNGDLYRNLLVALRELGDPDLPLRIEPRELLTLVLQARLALLPDHDWEPVASAVRAALLDRFGFGQRALGQGARLADVQSVIQTVRGVAWVDVDAFGAVPEKQQGADGSRVLMTQGAITDAVGAILQPAEFTHRRAHARAARPAQLAIFTPTVPDTLILNPLPS